MRKIAATWIYTLTSPPLKNGIVTVDEKGFITGITDTDGTLQESEKLEFYSGIVAPGFVNAHCHLELSHLKGAIPREQGLGRFVGAINRLRGVSEDEALTAATKADREMAQQGIVCAGDISNTTLTLPVKQRSKIRYITFAESFGFHPNRAERAFGMALNVREEFNFHGLQAFVTPHSPYSVSTGLFQLIGKLAKETRGILSMHNQESEAENQIFLSGDGEIMDHIRNNLGIDVSHFRPTGRNSLESVMPLLPDENHLLLVHNTFTTKEDINKLSTARDLAKTWFVLCPNSNLFIENKLPPVQMLWDEKVNICIGTDSLASNPRLSVLSELATLQSSFPGLTIGTLLTWACRNGAMALGTNEEMGTIEIGKKPGLVLITGYDRVNGRLTTNSKVKPLI